LKKKISEKNLLKKWEGKQKKTQKKQGKNLKIYCFHQLGT
jgi:hypothetical protein